MFEKFLSREYPLEIVSSLAPSSTPIPVFISFTRVASSDSNEKFKRKKMVEVAIAEIQDRDCW